MSIFKCKMCGGTLEISENQSTAICEYCGTQQTLPKLADDRRVNLYDRANHFRRSNEYDKAMSIYEKILNEDSTDAEAYWSLVLCRYGIEYVEDPASHKRVPTVNRVQFTSIFDDDNYRSAISHADSYQRSIYEAEANAINEIQKGILAISQKEKPFDVFICYKETDANGRRTSDSVLANDLYHQLTAEGFKVFFSRITLEDKLGIAYEPYIFAALNSAKVMVVLGTRPEYFNAVWVRNEWSRYLALVRQSGGKKILIPAYRDMDPYDLPEEFSHLQAQDMSKLGFMQDLIRGIKKLTQPETQSVPAAQPVQTGNVNTNALLQRGFMALEDQEWDKANSFFDRVLDTDPHRAEAYLGKALVDFQCVDLNQLAKSLAAIDKTPASIKLKAGEPDIYAESAIVKEYAILGFYPEEEIRKLFPFDFYYTSKVAGWEKLRTANLAAWDTNRNLSRGIAYSGEKQKQSLEDCRKTIEKTYDPAIEKAKAADKSDVEDIIRRYHIHLEDCRAEAAKQHENALVMKQKKEEEEAWQKKQLRIQQQEKERQKAKRRKIIGIVFAAFAAFIIFLPIWQNVIVPANQYKQAVAFMEAGQYEEAITAFKALGDYKDSPQLSRDSQYLYADVLMAEGKYEEAIASFKALGDYKDSTSNAEFAFEKYKIQKLNQAKVGDGVFWGTYEQDNDTTNGKEDIEWLVLDIQDGKALVISKYALDCQPYNYSYTDVTWETCTLRTWLNDTFLDTAFTDTEKSRIPTVTVSGGIDFEYTLDDYGNDTQDRVFLLIAAETYEYYNSVGTSAMQCEATAYAEAQGAEIGRYDGNCYWWLRAPGGVSGKTSRVSVGNGAYRSGGSVNSDDRAVRPAMWISLEP